MNGNYLIPANSKKSMLKFGLFNTVDLIILGIGLGVTIFTALIFPLRSTLITAFAVLPAMIAVFLVFPIPNYHNVRTFIGSMIKFFSKNNKYVWKGWCVRDGEDEKK